MDRTDELIEKVLSGEELETKTLTILAKYVANLIEIKKPMYQLFKEADEEEMARLLCVICDCDTCAAKSVCKRGMNGFKQVLKMSRGEFIDFVDREKDEND